MPGVGAPPKTTSRTRHKPIRGSWKAAPGTGWQHGPIPDPPDVGAKAVAVWQVWFTSWYAANWTPEYLPQIVIAIQLWDQCQRAFDDPYIETERGGHLVSVPRPNPVTELRQAMDGIGASFKGQQDRRWARPDATKAPALGPDPQVGRYAHLRPVPDEATG